MADADSPLLRFRLWRAALPPALRLLLTINLAVFIAAAVAGILAAFGLGGLAAALGWLALPGVPEALLVRPWTPLTYGVANLFLGDPLWTIIGFAFAMYWLNWLGRDYEETYGSYRLFGLYLASALFGAAVAMALALMPSGPLVHVLYYGAWGPVTAVLVCVATLQPNRGVGLFLLGVVPMKWIAVGFVALSLFRPDPTLLGAALFGLLFGLAQKRGVDLAAWARPFFSRASAGGYGGYATYGGQPRPGDPSVGARVKRMLARQETPEERPGRGAPPRRRSERRPRPASSGQAEVDRILDKILEDGFDALTDEEKRILDEASRRP